MSDSSHVMVECNGTGCMYIVYNANPCLIDREWDSNPSCMVVESYVTVEIIDEIIMTAINLSSDVRLYYCRWNSTFMNQR